MEFVDYGDGSSTDVNSDDADEQSLITVVLDDSICSDEINNRFGKNACRSAPDLV